MPDNNERSNTFNYNNYYDFQFNGKTVISFRFFRTCEIVTEITDRRNGLDKQQFLMYFPLEYDKRPAHIEGQIDPPLPLK